LTTKSSKHLLEYKLYRNSSFNNILTCSHPEDFQTESSIDIEEDLEAEQKEKLNLLEIMNFKFSYEVLESNSIELNSDKSFIDY
jgi:regulator of RNase E activity RraB